MASRAGGFGRGLMPLALCVLLALGGALPVGAEGVVAGVEEALNARVLELEALVASGEAALKARIKELEAAAATGGEAWKGKVGQLEGEVRRLGALAQECAAGKDSLLAKISSLEARATDAEAVAAAKERDVEAGRKEHQASASRLQALAEAAEKRAKEEEAGRKQAEAELNTALGNLKEVTEQLRTTEAKLQRESAIVSQLAKELPTNEEASQGQGLVERLRQTLERQTNLAKEVERLRGILASGQEQLKEGEAERAKLQRQLQELQGEAQRHKEVLAQVSEHWLPPWLGERLEVVQEQAQQQWEKNALPTVLLVRSQSLNALDYTRKQVEPHLEQVLEGARDVAASTRTALRPHLELAKQRHAEAMVWLAERSAELQRAAEPHVKATTEALNKGLEQAQEAAAPYLKQASDVISPYYEEAYAAAKPGLDALQASAQQYWRSASEAVGPQLEQLAQTSKHYQRQVSGIVANITQAGVESPSDLRLFLEVGLYVLVALLVVYLALRLCLIGGKGKDGKKGKGKGAGGKKQAHNSSHGHHSSGSHPQHQKKHHAPHK